MIFNPLISLNVHIDMNGIV